MFDKPEQELKRLENELLKAEMSDEDFERFYDDLYEEFGPVETQQPEEDFLQGSPVNSARKRTNQPSSQPNRRPAQSSRQPQRPTGRKHYGAQPQKRYDPIKILTITACAECAGIVGIVLWWLLRIL